MSLPSHTTAGPAAYAPCPPWCASDFDGEYSGPPFNERSRDHRGPDFRLSYADPSNPALPPREVVVEIVRFDVGGVVGAVEVCLGAVAANVRGERCVGGLYPDDPMGLDDAERLAHLLLRVVAFGRGVAS
jgi:hypothetical protein